MEAAIAKTNYAETYINSKDKEPTWDGFIYLYKKPSNVHKKEDYEDRLPVQIKGCQKNSPKRKSIKYSVDINDLKNFLRDGGVIFFVVYFDNEGENRCIYYKSLLPYDLIQLLNDNANNKTCSIKLKPFPKDASEITDVLLNFSNHKKMQAAIKSKDQLFSLEEISKKESVTEINIPITSHKVIDNPINYLFDHDGYVYATTPLGYTIPLNHFERVSLAQRTRNTCITIGDTVYYNHSQVQYEEKCTRFLIGKSIILTLLDDTKKLKLDFKLKGTLSERISDSEFFLAMSDNGGFSINGLFLSFTPEESNRFNRQAFKQKLDDLIEIRQVLQAFDVVEELDMDNMNDIDYKMLFRFISSFKGNEIPLADIGQPFGLFSIGNLKILITTQKNDETGLYRIYNFYEPLYRLFIEDSQGKKHFIPLFMGLKKDDLLKCSNFNSERLLQEFSEIQYDPTVSEAVTLWLLELIKAYDSSNKEKPYLLDTAQKVIDLIKKNDKFIIKTTFRLNELQIIKRKRNLNFAEKAELYDIIKNCNEDNIEIKIGASILLDENEKAKILLVSLSKERQEQFMEYPIYSLLVSDDCI